MDTRCHFAKWVPNYGTFTPRYQTTFVWIITLFWANDVTNFITVVQLTKTSMVEMPCCLMQLVTSFAKKKCVYSNFWLTYPWASTNFCFTECSYKGDCKYTIINCGELGSRACINAWSNYYKIVIFPCMIGTFMWTSGSTHTCLTGCMAHWGVQIGSTGRTSLEERAGRKRTKMDHLSCVIHNLLVALRMLTFEYAIA